MGIKLVKARPQDNAYCNSKANGNGRINTLPPSDCQRQSSHRRMTVRTEARLGAATVGADCQVYEYLRKCSRVAQIVYGVWTFFEHGETIRGALS
jgi:hypothetical protein